MAPADTRSLTVNPPRQITPSHRLCSARVHLGAGQPFPSADYLLAVEGKFAAGEWCRTRGSGAVSCAVVRGSSAGLLGGLVSFPRFSGHLFFGDTGRRGRSLDACTAPAGVPPCC